MTSVDADGQYSATAGEPFPSLRPSAGRWRALVLNWRDWPLATKLVALMAVPTLVVVVLGAVLVHSQITESDGASRQEQLTKVTDQTRGVVAQLAAMRAGQAEGPSAKQLTGKAAGLQHAVGAAGLNGLAKQRYDTARDAVGKVASADPVPPEADGRYTSAITSLLDLQSVVSKQLSAPELTPLAAGLYRLDSAREEVARQQTILRGAADGDGLDPDGLGKLRASETRYTSDVDEFLGTPDRAAKDAYTAATRSDEVSGRTALVGTVLGHSSESTIGDDGTERVPVHTPAARIDRLSTATTSAFDRVADRLAGKLSNQGAALADDASNTVGETLVLLFIALMLSAAIAVVIVRQVLSSLRTLRTGALDVAEYELPEVVRAVRGGQQANAEVQPIEVFTREDVGELARAFDKVHAEAIRLAVEQAGLRAEYGSLFVNLSRRSQTLVQRQLRLLERLERDEEDADQLDTLFQLDHLATRMRRNNENLIVLSGGELGRGPGQPLPMADLLRAAVSEVEQYQRVAVDSPENVHVVGYAASDLVRLVAELLDNATSFSAPDTRVQLSCDFTAGALRIVIADEGIGMSPSELEAANEQLHVTDADQMPAARRMGLFVVGRLAAQYDVDVRLQGRSGGRGIQAEIVLPRQLVSQTDFVENTAPELPGEREEAAPRLPSPRPAAPVEPEPRSQPPRAEPPRPEPARAESPRAELPSAEPPEPAPAAADDGDDLFAPAVAPRHGHPAPERRTADFEGDQPSGERPAAPEVRPSGFEQPLAGSAAGLAGSALFDPDVPAPGDARGGPDAEPAQPAPEPGLGAGLVNGAAAARWSVRQTFNGGVQYRLVGPTATPRAGEDEGLAAPEGGSEDLFAPRQQEQRHTTPIFDEMASGWFADAQETSAPLVWPDNTSVVGDPSTTPGAWSPSDSGWREAESVANSSPSSYTDVGLPMRTPKAHLVRGSMNGSARRPAQPERDANEVHQRYSSFRRGIDQGRHALGGQTAGEQSPEREELPARDEPAMREEPQTQEEPRTREEFRMRDEPATREDPRTRDEPAARDEFRAQEEEPRAEEEPRTREQPAVRDELPTREQQPVRDRETGPIGGPARREQPGPPEPEQGEALPPLPRRVPGQGLPDGAASRQAEEPEPHSGAGSHSLFESESDAAVPEAAPSPVPRSEPGPPSELTSVGLPKRTRGAQLIPRENGSTDAVRRDSEEVRNSLSSLQRGVARGWQERGKAHAQRAGDDRQENE